MRGTLLGYTPKQRVEAAEARIQLPHRTGRNGDRFRQCPARGDDDPIGEKGVFVVAPADLNDPLAERPRRGSRRAVQNLTQALKEVEEARRAKRSSSVPLALPLRRRSSCCLSSRASAATHRWLCRTPGRGGGAQAQDARHRGVYPAHRRDHPVHQRDLSASRRGPLSLVSLYLWLDFLVHAVPLFPALGGAAPQLHDNRDQGHPARRSWISSRASSSWPSFF